MIGKECYCDCLCMLCVEHPLLVLVLLRLLVLMLPCNCKLVAVEWERVLCLCLFCVSGLMLGLGVRQSNTVSIAHVYLPGARVLRRSWSGEHLQACCTGDL